MNGWQAVKRASGQVRLYLRPIAQCTSSNSTPNFFVSTVVEVAPIDTSAFATPSKSSSTKESTTLKIALRKVLEILPTMPKSMNPTLPYAITSHFIFTIVVSQITPINQYISVQSQIYRISILLESVFYTNLPSANTRRLPACTSA